MGDSLGDLQYINQFKFRAIKILLAENLSSQLISSKNVFYTKRGFMCCLSST